MIVQNYRIGRVIARGGMATVYRGVYRPTGMPVAIKVLSEESAQDDVLVFRFHQEARIQNVLGREHPAIVTCYEPLVVDGRPGLVLEYVPGEAVVDILDDEGRFDIVEAIDIILQVLDALAYAHHHGVVHRDIKADNIMVTPEGRVKLADFGVARAEIGSPQTRLTEARDLVGTMVYMAPEQLTSPRTVDHRSDLYSVGVTLYEMVTGEVPFDGEESYPLMKRIEMEAPPDPREARPEMGDALAEVLLKSLAKDPDDRFFTAGDFDAALRRCLREMDASASDVVAQTGSRTPRGFQPGEPGPLPEPRQFGYLEDLSGALIPGRMLLRRAGLKLGRSARRCDVVIPDDAVAAEHALLLPLEDGSVLLVDLMSEPGTTLGGYEIQRERLEHGDEFAIGERWRFRFCR